MPASNKKVAAPADFVCGLFSKKDAALMIIGGTGHVHSSTLGQNDAVAKLTVEAMQKKTIPKYPWEITEGAQELGVVSSSNRHEVIGTAVKNCGLANRRDMSEKFSSIMEELISNAVFHAYHQPNGEPKYSRRQRVNLDPSETITLKFNGTPHGVFISITDRGGSLKLEDLSRVFSRTYGSNGNQIESKEGGAGLGMYMILEYVTHLKVESDPGKRTTISCWLSDNKHYDPDYFSFNFFSRRQE